MTQQTIQSVQQESRLFAPSQEFVERANISPAEAARLRQVGRDHPEALWRELATLVHWETPFHTVSEWSEPFAKFYLGGKLNVSYNCLDRHLNTPRRHKAAIIWEGESGEVKTLTYQQVHQEVCRLANGLKRLGVRPGDRVVIYMPMIPEIAVACLATARIGATHSVIFGGFSSEALVDRINDCGAKVVITADGGFRKGDEVPLKIRVDTALAKTPSVEHVIVVTRTKSAWGKAVGRDHAYEEFVAQQSDDCPAEPFDSEHPLFILYTSGTTGKPKGVVHSSGGYLVQTTFTTRAVLDLKEEDLYFCTADVGWITGHSYVVYGPLSLGATLFMYEGAPTYPGPDRLWSMIARHKVTILYTAPTAIRALMRLGEQWPQKHNLASLRLLGTVGEPINPEAWIWYYQQIGGGRCPVVDTWWQTETGAMMIAPIPSEIATRPGSCTMPLPGVDAVIVDRQGQEVPDGHGGLLVLRKPWPSMMRNIYGDPERFARQYFGEIPGVYFTGDGARKDLDGYFWVMGRVDDVINVSGHRLGTAEVESALVSHPAVAESAVVGRPDEIKGQAICAFVTLQVGQTPSPELAQALKVHVVKEIGALARPDEIRFSEALPKTRSGKIMRRLLREVAMGGEVTGDTTTLEDLNVLAALRAPDEE
jgi:acetyl-CoA synthetase